MAPEAFCQAFSALMPDQFALVVLCGFAGAMAYHIVIGACSAVLSALSRRRIKKAMAAYNLRRYG